MRRHMQNISFVTIIGMILSCAFFFSQQTKANLRSTDPVRTVTPAPKSVTLDDLPDCPAALSLDERHVCLERAVEVSGFLLEARVDEILDQTPNSEQRMAFMELAFAWEESREADCEFLRGLAEDELNASVQYLACLTDHNLNRLTQLEAFLCGSDSALVCPVDETAVP
jgi:uncharacterized protein YecT (DUF1311 family)